jgi:adenosylcobyric acid synthase
MGRALMIQGTASHVGKSVVTAGLCRLFVQEGFRVAPFKAQNMSLNSGVTPDGGEISRAQLAQAEAARVAPTVHMNPILLKPTGDRRSQLIIHGRASAEVSAGEYQARMQELVFGAVEASLRHLMDTFDIVVIEGAGSPAEVNLTDIANMPVAALAQAPVLLVADIERGGALAAAVGTIELLPPHHRRLVCGLLINKFRGDMDLLRPGLTFLEERTGVPVLGVLPYLDDVDIQEEDSLGVRSTRSGPLRIAVVKLPHLSNFTDFAPLERVASVRYVPLGEKIGPCDLIVLPGTKNTAGDLVALRASGTSDQVLAAAQLGIPILGICGGYQMLGRRVRDPEGVESTVREVEGLGLLPITTTFTWPKVTHQVEADVITSLGPFAELTGQRLHGYEIHAGRTDVLGPAVVHIRTRSGDSVDVPDGAITNDGRIFGVSLHGLFDNDGVLVAFLRWLGATPREQPREDVYDRLAQVLRQHLDLPALFSAVGLEVSRWA